MESRLQHHTASHRFLLEQVRAQAGLADPVAFDADEFRKPLLERARKGRFLAVDGVLVRDWGIDGRREFGLRFGMRLFHIGGVRFVRVLAGHGEECYDGSLDFLAVDRRDYARLYRLALACRREQAPAAVPPVLADEHRRVLWQHTIGFLEPDQLRRYREFGVRPRRGVLLLGPPGNGKTMACRWIWEECRQRGWEYRLVSAAEYQEARQGRRCKEAIAALFTLEKKGVLFFDDMDIALRDRDTVKETDDQSIFLTALDGITVNDGLVFVFTSNCAPELIDRAFRRPGRLDLVMHFKEPDAALRRRLVERWHPAIRQAIDPDQVVASTDGCSFAELEELKNLLVMQHQESLEWDWGRALAQFDRNRRELGKRKGRVGFTANGA